MIVKLATFSSSFVGYLLPALFPLYTLPLDTRSGIIKV